MLRSVCAAQHITQCITQCITWCVTHRAHGRMGLMAHLVHGGDGEHGLSSLGEVRRQHLVRVRVQVRVRFRVRGRGRG